MKKEEIQVVVKKQREYFKTGETIGLKFRIAALKKLKKAIEENADKINEALEKDLGKSAFEGFMCETGLVLSEISFLLKNIKRFSKDRTKITPLTNFAARSYVKKSPYGVCLIMSPWNYPFLLTMEPLADAIAAGNTCVVKPSAYSPNTTKVMERIIKENFGEQYIAFVDGGREENSHLLEEKFDYIFFTGGKNVGRLVMEKASRHLTPITLELGGKSPCIVDETANIKLAAKRIVWGKYLNCGQTCVAPDYILCHESVKAELAELLKEEIDRQFKDAMSNPDYGKIINEKHFDRIIGLIDESKVIIGGGKDRSRLKIEPTVMDNVTWEDKVMGEEIFGPLIPILTYENIADVINIVNERPSPLALYIFSNSGKTIEKVTSLCSFGGGCVNDVVIHLATSHMGFGGMGESGMGAYHGKYGFDTFSHEKSIVDKKTWIDLPMRYQPFNRFNEKLIHMFLR